MAKKDMNKNLATTWSREDRDLLVELRTEMGGVRADIKSLNESVDKTAGDHEGRIRALEAQSARWLGKESLVGGLVGILASVCLTLFGPN